MLARDRNFLVFLRVKVLAQALLKQNTNISPLCIGIEIAMDEQTNLKVTQSK